MCALRYRAVHAPLRSGARDDAGTPARRTASGAFEGRCGFVMNNVSIQGARRAQQIGNRPEAVRLCREILRVNPKDFDALYLLGYLHSQAGELEEAERLIAEALK